MDDIASEVTVKPVLKDDAEVVIPLRISKPIQSGKASITASVVTNNGVKKQLSASLDLVFYRLQSEAQSEHRGNQAFVLFV